MGAMKIWKWSLKITDTQTIEMPHGAKILCVQTQRGDPQLWALVNEGGNLEQRIFATYGTGHTVPDSPGEYVGTYQVVGDQLVFHVFENLRS